MEIKNRISELKIATKKRFYKIFIAEQKDGIWIASVLYDDNHEIKAEHVLGKSKNEVYKKASLWTLENIDNEAIIEPL